MHPELTICGSTEVVGLVESAAAQGRPFHAVISIEHPCDETISLEEGRAPRLAEAIGPQWQDRQLILVCWDLEAPHPGIPLPGPEIILKSLEHARAYAPENEPLRLLVHCRSGKSRSPAVALAVLRDAYGRGTEAQCLQELLRVRPVAAPNIVLVQHADNILDCDEALVRAVEADPGITERRAENEAKR